MFSQYINEIPPDIFSDLKQIGSGSFASIYSAIHVKTNTPVALKISYKGERNEKLQYIHQELVVHKSLNHPLICKYYTDIETEHLMIVVMELIEGLNLLEYVNRSGGLSIQETKKIFSQIVIVIEYLHEEHNIAHRDLKLENIMVDNYGNIRLIDFGLSSQKRIMSTICGSVAYCAPEVLKSENYTKMADIWCLGVILYSMAFGKLPFYDNNIVKLANIICRDEPNYPMNCDPLLLDLLKKLLMKIPCYRISIEEIKNHDFMSHVRLLQINYKQLFSPTQSSPIISKRKSEYKIKFSQSHINLSNSPILETPNRIFHLSLPGNANTNNHSQIAELHKIVTMNPTNIDDLISNRKDYSKKLNQLIEFAFLIDTRNSFIPGDKLRFSAPKPIHLNFSNVVIRRNSHHNSLFVFPQFKKPS